jgi:23S rRNA-/tRNA-specific pseudouridylate synthase
MGHPILGDPQYGSRESQLFSATLGLTHQMLCAKELAFQHPITGENLCLESRMNAAL